MSELRAFVKSIARYFDLYYFLKFAIIMTGLYCFNLFYLGITDPKNYYSPFLDRHLNYISWFNSSILHTAQLIDRGFGFSTIVSGACIYIPDGDMVILTYECLGLGITAFWVAFVVAHKGDWKKRSVWALAGAGIIWCINCIRIAVLMLAFKEKWPDNKYMDHHDTFNLATYVFVMLLMYVYTRRKETKPAAEHGTKTSVVLRTAPMHEP